MCSKTILTLAAGVLLAGCADEGTGPDAALFQCAMGEAASTAPGQVLKLAGAGGLCIESGSQAGDFIFVPFLAIAAGDTAVARNVEVVAGGITSPSGLAPSLGATTGTLFSRRRTDLAESELRIPDEAFHATLRRREIRELIPRIRGGDAPGGATEPAAVPTIGTLLSLNTSATCDRLDVRTGRVRAIGTHSIIVEDTANPAPGLADDDVNFFAMTFDTLVYDVGTTYFGEPADIDQNQRAIIFFTRAVNERTPANAEAYVAGFFWAGDLFPPEGNERLAPCASSNEAEMFYMLAPDPNGVVNGNVFKIDFVRRTTVATIGHEFQHLINASLRLFVNNANSFERIWLNEGLSHIAEELLFYAASGLGPGMNYTVEDLRSTEEIRSRANQFLVSNISRYIDFMERPDTASAMGDDNLANRGAIWAFLRYAADRSGVGDAAFFQGLVHTRDAGVNNLRTVFGEDPLAWMNDWAVAVLADDYVPGVDTRYAQPSWNFRSVVPALLGEGTPYPLQVRTLNASQGLSLNLLPGGVAYPSFGLDAGRRGVITLDAATGEARKAVRGALLRVR